MEAVSTVGSGVQKIKLKKNNVVFDGGAGDFLVTGIIAFLVTACTFGICYPWALCMKEKWVINHTVIDGRRMRFEGSAIGLFGNWIKWFFFCVITFGIYSFWVVPELQKWKAANTYID